MLIWVQIFTHLISRGLVVSFWLGGERENEKDGEKKKTKKERGFTFQWRIKIWPQGDEEVLLTTVLKWTFLPLFLWQEGKSSVAEIRLSFASERFHLEHEVIALIEVAFITLTYYMLKMRWGRPLYLPTAPQKILKPGLGGGGGAKRCSAF